MGRVETPHPLPFSFADIKFASHSTPGHGRVALPLYSYRYRAWGPKIGVGNVNDASRTRKLTLCIDTVLGRKTGDDGPRSLWRWKAEIPGAPGGGGPQLQRVLRTRYCRLLYDAGRISRARPSDRDHRQKNQQQQQQQPYRQNRDRGRSDRTIQAAATRRDTAVVIIARSAGPLRRRYDDLHRRQEDGYDDGVPRRCCSDDFGRRRPVAGEFGGRAIPDLAAGVRQQ
ncbi:Hypothetical protein CINCED_3A007633 [Cinara cedri]|uniref:Uncharacterized protein n=1 Tax=Cinara cedri TaxID=506608 RepID=A0A5E4MQ75_9HEMI|nr:Hypothetical protein CINCED_3A007633 [Cinara cedri]